MANYMGDYICSGTLWEVAVSRGSTVKSGFHWRRERKRKHNHLRQVQNNVDTSIKLIFMLILMSDPFSLDITAGFH